MVVTTTPDPRADLEQTVRQHVPDTNLSRIDHAIALFRQRGASVEDKRSACKDLADVLENRRPLLRKQLRSKDEGALFQIANEFAVRHHDGKQHVDYAQEQFLDWIFWIYLATVELSNRLMARSPALKQVGDA